MNYHTDDERVYLDDLRILCGMSPALTPIAHAQRKHGANSYEALALSEREESFLELMHNRLIMGALRYGKLRELGKPQYDRVVSMVKRLKKYEETGNQEHLVDVANIALLEFAEPGHSSPHWNPIDDGEHMVLDGVKRLIS